MNANDLALIRGLNDGKSMFGGDWVPAIVVALRDGPKHYRHLLRLIQSLNLTRNGHQRVLHESVLARTLKTLVANGLIHRETIGTGFPPSVRYSLRPETQEALEAMRPLADWANRHPDLINTARQRRNLT